MRILKITTEYRVESESEVAKIIEKKKENQTIDRYAIISCNYTYKEKKSKGEVIDNCFVVKIVKEYNKVWEEVNG